MIVDLNKTQKTVDWDVLAPLLDFVPIKASGLYANQGDPLYAQHVAGAVSQGVPFHAFHFLYCKNETEARRDAGLFFRIVKGQGHWPVAWVLDCEAGWGIEYSKARPVAEAFETELRRLAAADGLDDINVAIYIGHNRYREYALDYAHYYYRWIPRYGANDGTLEAAIKPDHPCDLWQYTSHGRVPGIVGDVDLSVLTGSLPLEHFKCKMKKEEKSVAQKMPIKQFVAELETALNRGDGYIMGAYGQNPRTGYLDLSVPESKCKAAWKPEGYYYKQYLDPKEYKTDKQYKQALKWREKCTRVWDCNGLAEGIYELFSGVCINSKARHNYAEWCDPKGGGMIPVERRVPGAAVFWSDNKASNIHHVAYLYKPVKADDPTGDWYLIEAKGVMYGVVKSKLYSRKPNFWGIMSKYFDYSGEPAPTPPPEPKLGDRDLKKGDKGADVKELQQDLMKLGYKLTKYSADGDFGSETQKAVKAFQKDHGLKEDGVMNVGADYDALFAALNGDTPVPTPVKQMVEITGDSVNVRSAPGTTGTRVLGVAHKGDRLPYQGQTSNTGGRDWYLVEYDNANGWVSSKYARLIE